MIYEYKKGSCGFMVSSTVIVGSKIRLREKRLADVSNDYFWQTDPELARLDAAPQLTMTFSEYLAKYVGEQHYVSSIRHPFAIEDLDGKHIGNCAYYGIDEAKREAELGIMIGDRDYWDRGYGTDAVSTLLDYIFHQTNLARIYLKTLDWNTRAQKCFRKCGFTPYGQMARDGYNFVRMEIRRKQWKNHKTKV